MNPTENKTRGYSCIGLHMPKDPKNIGSVLRAMDCYGAQFTAISGTRFKKSGTDTMKAWRHHPVFNVNDLKDIIPYDCVPVAVDLVEGATPLTEYKHPARAFYIFGPEDGTLNNKVLDWCRDTVYVPTNKCMNLAATVNVVLDDRLAKSLGKPPSGPEVNELDNDERETILAGRVQELEELTGVQRNQIKFLLSLTNKPSCAGDCDESKWTFCDFSKWCSGNLLPISEPVPEPKVSSPEVNEPVDNTLLWTTEKPTEEGYHFVKTDEDQRTTVFSTSGELDNFYEPNNSKFVEYVKDFKYFCGPLPEPKGLDVSEDIF